jgi:hypothetical protein
MNMTDIELSEDCNEAIVDGKAYVIRGFDYAGQEAIIIPALDLISYDEGETWSDME